MKKEITATIDVSILANAEDISDKLKMSMLDSLLAIKDAILGTYQEILIKMENLGVDFEPFLDIWKKDQEEAILARNYNESDKDFHIRLTNMISNELKSLHYNDSFKVGIKEHIDFLKDLAESVFISNLVKIPDHAQN